MKNELFSIGPFTIYGYGLMIAIGIISAYFVGEYRAKKYGLEADHVFNYVIWCVVGGFSGSKLLYFITNIKNIMENPDIMHHSRRVGRLRGDYRRYFVCHAVFENQGAEIPRLF